MTFSIVARSANASQWGVAVASKFLAVGTAVPAARSAVGADRAGGDKRGRQSAALLVAGEAGGSDVLVDLWVDDHSDPVPALREATSTPASGGTS